MPCIRCQVTGRVQGVFFRASAYDRARQLGLTGNVRNLPDGRVEVLACGEQVALDALQEWLQQGPPQASVSGVQVDSIPGPAPESFEIS